MKIIFKCVTKRVPETNEYDDLLLYAAKVFKSRDVKHRTMYYMDEDNDIISVTCQSDFVQALRDMTGRVKIVIAESEDEARETFMSRSLGSSNTMLQGLGAGHNLCESYQETSPTKKRKESNNTHSVNLGNSGKNFDFNLGGSGKGFNFDMFLEQKIQEKVIGMDLSPIK